MSQKVAHRFRFDLWLIAAVLLIFSGCINDNELCAPAESPEDGGEGITMEFTMLTRNAESSAGSRTLLPPSGNTEVGFGAENYLDLENLTFLLFDDRQKMLRTFKPDVEVIDDDTAPYVKYSVRTFLHDKYFLYATGETIEFTIVVLGNYAGHSPDRFNYYIGQDLTEIFDQSAVGTFAIPKVNNDVNTWIPTVAPVAGQATGHIPMAGMQTFTVSTSDLRASTPDRPYQLSGGELPKYINMLRALAKIEIVDKIGEGLPADTHFLIKKVELMGHASRGSILPSFKHWRESLETQYVTEPSVPQSSEYRGVVPVSGLNTTAADTEAIIEFFPDTDATAAREDGCNVFSCYLTEYDPAFRGVVPGMWMRLSMTSPDTGETGYYRIEVASYDNGRPGELIPILRNNIYRYVITDINDVSLDIQPFANMELSFGFGLMRDAQGDLMVLPDKDGNYPDYFQKFVEKHDYPQAIDEDGNPTGEAIRLEEGDYYAIIVGENEEMSEAVIWVKDRDACHVLSNFGVENESQRCSARLVESVYGNNVTERFYKDIYGYRRIHHFNNHNSIVRHPVDETLLFCYIENFRQPTEIRRYYEVESWDESTSTGWIVNKDDDGNETGFQKITSEGTLGETKPMI